MMYRDTQVTLKRVQVGVHLEKRFIAKSYFDSFQALSILGKKTDGSVGLSENDTIHFLGEEVILDGMRFHPALITHMTHRFDRGTGCAESREIRDSHTQYNLADMFGIFF